ncbi:hypothetical protein FQZ97_1197320 [compost metagenome]
MPVVIVSAGNVSVSPAPTDTAVPLLPAVGAVAVNAVVLLAPPVVAPMLATLPVVLPAVQALASCNVAALRVLV